MLWKLKDQAEGAGKRENAEKIKEKLEALKDVIPQIKTIEVGIGIDLPGSTWDIVLYTEFASQADLDAYQNHPKHQEAGIFIKLSAAGREAVDYII